MISITMISAHPQSFLPWEIPQHPLSNANKPWVIENLNIEFNRLGIHEWNIKMIGWLKKNWNHPRSFYNVF